MDRHSLFEPLIYRFVAAYATKEEAENRANQIQLGNLRERGYDYEYSYLETKIEEVMFPMTVAQKAIEISERGS